MHRLVLENGEHGLRFVQQRMSRLLDRRVGQRVENARVALVGESLHLFARRPFGPLTAAGGRLVFRIDAAGEQPLEPVVNARRPSPFFTNVLRLKAGRCPS